jgi:hypothetical protein
MDYLTNVSRTADTCELNLIRLRHQIPWLDLPPQNLQMLIIRLLLLLSLHLIPLIQSLILCYQHRTISSILAR